MFSHLLSFRFSLALLLSLFLLLTACGQATSTKTSSQPKPTSTAAFDYYGTPVVFPTTAPQRIVSLVPSTSEILGALRLQGRVVGVDYYTTYPPELASLPKVSDANGKFNVEQIVALKPDLVLSYGGQTKEYDFQLKNLGLRVVDLPFSNLSQTLQQILLIGHLTLTENIAVSLVNQLQQQINTIKAAVAGTTAPGVLLEVDDSTPGKPFVFGGGSFGDELLRDANGINVFHNNSSNGGYPQVTDEAIFAANPQFVILTEDPVYGGNPALVYRRPNWNSIDALKMHQVYRINVNIMQHPGPRLVEGLRCLAQIIHPEKFSCASTLRTVGGAVSGTTPVIQYHLTRDYSQGAYLFNLDSVDEKRTESTMSQQENVRAMFTSLDISRLPVRERASLAIQAADAATAITRIREAEHTGVQQVWMTQSMGMLDTLTLFAAVATQTTRIRLGTSIVPVYPRHPLVMALQAATINDLAPGRLRLGVGTSHRHVIENIYGLSMPSPLAYLREYVEVMRQGLWEGRIDHQGRFFKVAASIPRPAQIPLLISALGERAFHLAGEIADGAISWVCPVPYLLDTALPALRDGAHAQNRPVPPLVAHIPVAMSTDEAAVQAAATPRISFYTKAPFYTHMFASAGFPIAADGTGVDALVKALVVAGDQAQVEKRLRELLTSGLDELLLMLVPVADETREREQLMQVIASL